MYSVHLQANGANGRDPVINIAKREDSARQLAVRVEQMRKPYLGAKLLLEAILIYLTELDPEIRASG